MFLRTGALSLGISRETLDEPQGAAMSPGGGLLRRARHRLNEPRRFAAERLQ